MIREVLPINYKSIPKEELETWFENIEFKKPLFKHQLVSLAFTLGEKLNRVMLNHDIGTGKTYTALALTLCWNPTGKMLIVSPKGVLKTWRTQTNGYTDFTVVSLTGSKEERNIKLGWGIEKISLLNYEGLRVLFSSKEMITDDNPTGIDYEKIKQSGFEAIIFDEMHHLKSVEAQQTKIARELSKRARYVIGLTGTPLGKSAMDLFSQYLVLDNGRTLGDNVNIFRNIYFYRPMPKRFYYWEPKRICHLCNAYYTGKTEHLKTVHGIDLTTYRRITNGKRERTSADVILDMVSSCTLRYSKEECTDLPEKIYQVRSVEPTSDQQRATGERVEKVLRERTTKGNLEVSTQQLVEITGGFIQDGVMVEHLTPNPKLQELEDILPQINGKCIIFHYYHEEAKMIEKLLKRCGYTYSIVNGTIPTKRQELAKEAFIKDHQFLIAQPKSGGEGIDGLQVASIEIFYSRAYMGSILREQAEGRIHRTGQTQSCTYIDIVLEDTIDEVLFHSLKKNTDFFKSVMDYLQKKYLK